MTTSPLTTLLTPHVRQDLDQEKKDHDPIEYDKALEVLTLVVARQGREYVYEQDGGACLYVHNTEPSCLIGKVLFLLGWTIEELVSYDCGGTSSIGITALIEHGYVPVADKRVEVLFGTAQDAQDLKSSWGTALDRAVLAVSNL